MIVSASYRTDIPAFYGRWFAQRLQAGYAIVANPYGGTPYRVSLRPADVDAFVFWTRNIRPFSDELCQVADLGIPFMVQYTITGYARALETATPETARSIEAVHSLAADHGPRAVVWRYDPVLLSSLTPSAYHLANFSGLADALAGAVDEVCISFAHIYRKTRRNLRAAAEQHDFTWEDPETSEKQRLREQLEAIASARGMRLTVCSQAEVGGMPARCVDAGRLAEIAGRPLAARQQGNRPGCLCAQSRDIGAYDTCPHGCVYCYAVGARAHAVTRYKQHDPSAEALVPLKATETV